jgi:hypothetical protein
MEDLLGFIFELLFEALFELILGVIVAGAYRALRRFFVTARRGNPMTATSVLIIVGFVLGFLSLLVFPHPLVPPSRLHGISLIISPVIMGLAMAAIGRGARRRGRVPVRIESFGYGFAFAFAFALVRLLMLR